jgi:hypothetical protein
MIHYIHDKAAFKSEENRKTRMARKEGSIEGKRWEKEKKRTRAIREEGNGRQRKEEMQGEMKEMKGGRKREEWI